MTLALPASTSGPARPYIEKPEPVREMKGRGRRNLLILGLVSILIAGVTTSIELFIYRRSGDIYLDRSRPGFLPDTDEAAEEEQATSSMTYSFPETGPLDASSLDEYLTHLQEVEDYINKIENPYSPTPLSNESLGI